MAFNLVDDGTLDTVLRCEGCEQESRYGAAHFDSSECEATKPGDVCYCYDRFIAWAKGDAKEQHECPESGIDPEYEAFLDGAWERRLFGDDTD